MLENCIVHYVPVCYISDLRSALFLPDDKILEWSKLKQIAEDILKCILNEK